MEVQKVLSKCSSQQGTFLKLRQAQFMSISHVMNLDKRKKIRAKNNPVVEENRTDF